MGQNKAVEICWFKCNHVCIRIIVMIIIIIFVYRLFGGEIFMFVAKIDSINSHVTKPSVCINVYRYLDICEAIAFVFVFGSGCIV